MGADTTTDLDDVRSDMQDVLYRAYGVDERAAEAAMDNELMPLVARYVAAEKAAKLEAGEPVFAVGAGRGRGAVVAAVNFARACRAAGKALDRAGWIALGAALQDAAFSSESRRLPDGVARAAVAAFIRELLPEPGGELGKTLALMRISESVTLTGPALADLLAEFDRRGALLAEAGA